MGGLQILFELSLYGYLLATIAYSVWFFWRNRKAWLVGTGLMGLAFALQLGFIIAMTVVGGRPPLSNTFETLVFFAACVAAIFLLSMRFYDSKPLAPLAALAALFVTLFAYLVIQDDVEPLVPALRNNLWLTVHVILCFVSYAAFVLAYLGALLYLLTVKKHATGARFAVAGSFTGVIAAIVVVLLSRGELFRDHRGAILFGAAGGAVALALGLWPAVGWLDRRLRIRERLLEKQFSEKMVYKNVALGFPFLALGIVTGSYWASQAWGRYWGWDPKETASLITLLVFTIYLHLRLVPKWRGPWVAWVAVIGFWCVLFTYFGVNYLLSGLHAYGG